MPPRARPTRHGRPGVARALLLPCTFLLVEQVRTATGITSPFPRLGQIGGREDRELVDLGDVGDVAHTCDVASVQVANVRQLHPILHDLVNTTFFRLFRVKLKNPSCPFWKSLQKEDKEHSGGGGGTCTGSVPLAAKPFVLGGAGFGMSSISGPKSFLPPDGDTPCGVDGEDEQEADHAQARKPSASATSSTFGAPLGTSRGAGARPAEDDDPLDRTITSVEREASEVRRLEGEGCEIEEDLPTYFADMCEGDSTKGEAEDVNLIKNPERNTGYNGSHIWEAMYNENCFEVGSSMPRGRYGSPGMCYEERVLYRLLSGWHASTTISIAKNFYAPGTKQKGAWVPNPARFMDVLGKHPERSKNLHFAFVVMLRAIKKAGPFLSSYRFSTGDGQEDTHTKNLMSHLLDSQVLSVCSPLFDAFDETRLFRSTSPEQRSQLKRQFKSVFRNITVLVDCVQCQRCRLHAKVFSLGLGSALKILLTPPELIAQTTSRDEVVALINVLWKLSESMEDARLLAELYWGQQQAPSDPAMPPPAASSAKAAATAAPATSVGAGQLGGQAAASTSGPPAAATSAAPLEAAQGLVATPLPAGSRHGLLDAALGAVRRAAASGALSPSAEREVLRSLVVPPGASDEVLLLAKHYAADRPEVFASLALEAGGSAAPRGAAAILAPALLGSPAAPADAIIIGGGLAGMVAAITLLDRGASVVLIEKQQYLGGNSGKASSGINAALETSVESLIQDTTKSAGVLARRDLIERLANDSAKAVDWLRNRITVDLSMRSQLGGHTVKRTLRPANAFVGAEITFAAGQLLSKVEAQQPDRLRLLLRTKWTGLARGGVGWRATAIVNNSEVVLEATSVLIASGGFGHDAKEAESLLLKHRPDLAGFPTTLGPQTTGDGVKIARGLGARLVDMDRVQLHPTGFVDPAKPQEQTKTLAAELLRGVGGLILDRNGRRFTDELGTRQAVVNAELAATKDGRSFPPPMPDRTFALVLNGKAAAMADRHVTLYSKKGLLRKVSGMASLAEHLSVPAAQLRETFDEYNQAAKAGRDLFNRTVFPAGHWPVEEEEDFYVGKIVPVIHYTMGGIAIDADGHVLAEADSKPIPGLYAAGEASGGVHGDNRLAGNSLLECTVFGRHVGLTLPVRDKAPAASTPAAAAATGPVAAAPQQPAAATRRVGAGELAGHKSREQRSWVGLYGQVYDLTDYIEDHPGGPEAILDVAGTDGTEHFAAVHNRELLERMGFEPIGVLTEE